MAIILDFAEQRDSRDVRLTGTGGEVTRTYLVRWYNNATGQYVNAGNVDPESAAIQFNNQVFAIGSQHPLFTNPFIELQDIRAEPFDRFAKVFATWTPKATQVGENSHGEVWKWNLGTQQLSIKTVARDALQLHYPAGDKHDIGKALNVDDQGNVNGIMVRRPSMTATVAVKIPNSNMDVQWNVVHARQNTVNSDPFWNFAAGEVLYLGAEIQKTANKIPDDDDGEWTFIHSFEAARQQEAVTWEFSDGTSQEITVKPWDAINVNFETDESEDGDGFKRVKFDILDVHVATVYDTSLFAAFNLHAPDQ